MSAVSLFTMLMQDMFMDGPFCFGPVDHSFILHYCLRVLVVLVIAPVRLLGPPHESQFVSPFDKNLILKPVCFWCQIV
jgi:hypothetical protein